MVITFDYETMAKIYQYTLMTNEGINNAHYLYAVDGLKWDDSVNEETTLVPCRPGFSPVSRWKLRSDLDETQCTNDLHEMTNSAFKHALETSNDDNELLRDIYLWNDRPEDGCHEDDYEKVGMFIMTSEGCFENMHPDHL